MENANSNMVLVGSNLPDLSFDAFFKGVFKKIGFSWGVIYVETDFKKLSLIDYFNLHLEPIIVGLPFFILTENLLAVVFYLGAGILDIIKVIACLFWILIKKYKKSTLMGDIIKN